MDFLRLKGRRFLLFGLANRKSIAWHTGRILIEAGAEAAFVVHTEAGRENAQKLFPGSMIFVCDVGDERQIAALAQAVKKIFPRLDGILHSIAFARYSRGLKPFHQTAKEDFLEAVDISCFSLLSIAGHFEDCLAEDASVVAMSISHTRMASENYGYMAPVKAALDSSICFLAKSFSRFSKVRFNAVKAGLLKTKSSAGIPDYVRSYLYAERLTLRREALRTEEVAQAVVFLLSPASSGINASEIILDAGMSVNYFDSGIIEAAMHPRNDP